MTTTSTLRPLVAYLRVSTARQGESGLGLESQQQSIQHFATVVGGEVVATFTEVESGRKTERQQLQRALQYAKRIGAKLVVAKLDRLGRDVAFISSLMRSGVDFAAVDQPNANTFTLHILAACAEEEARAISSRTREALKAAKRRGVALGSARPGHWDGERSKRRLEGGEKGRAVARERRLAASAAIYAAVKPVIFEMRSRSETLDTIAKSLNEAGHLTPRGKAWTSGVVHQVLSGRVAKDIEPRESALPAKLRKAR